MGTFYRDHYTVIWLTLASDEPLGVLDTSFLEDCDGTDGQVSLLHVSSGMRYPVPMNETTPEAQPHEQFTGWIAIGGLPDGDYEIQGRARDPLGNTVILGNSAAGIGPDDRVEHLRFTLAPGFGTVIQYGPLFIAGAIEATMSAPSLTWTFTPGSWTGRLAGLPLMNTTDAPVRTSTIDAPTHNATLPGGGP